MSLNVHRDETIDMRVDGAQEIIDRGMAQIKETAIEILRRNGKCRGLLMIYLNEDGTVEATCASAFVDSARLVSAAISVVVEKDKRTIAHVKG